jgi:transcriptional regulator with XRE-family HTH domain
VETKSEIREFLTSRRARITPDQAGLTAYRPRRVAGLRREEVAVLAGVSVPYYTRLERGELSGVSEGVLEALARALQLDDAEREHLFDLARAAGPMTKRRRRSAPKQIRPGVQRLLDAITGAPALIQNGRLDILALTSSHAPSTQRCSATRHGRPTTPASILNPAARDVYPDWERGADDAVALLRAEAGRDPYDRDLTDLIGELSTRSEEFRARWADHNVRLHQTGTKRFHHPVVGELTLTFEMMELAGDPGLNLLTFTAEPGTKSHEALNLLGSWAATIEQEQAAPTAGEA